MTDQLEKTTFCVADESYVKLKVENKKTAIPAVRKPIGALRNTLRNKASNPDENGHIAADASAVRCMPLVRKAGTNDREGTMVEGKNFGGAPVLGQALGLALENSPKKAVQVDVEKYQAWLDDPKLSDAQKEQIVEALWQIMVCFVDMGFGIAPLQEACGKLSEIEQESGDPGDDVLRSDADTLKGTFNTFTAE